MNLPALSLSSTYACCPPISRMVALRTGSPDWLITRPSIRAVDCPAARQDANKRVRRARGILAVFSIVILSDSASAKELRHSVAMRLVPDSCEQFENS